MLMVSRSLVSCSKPVPWKLKLFSSLVPMMINLISMEIPKTLECFKMSSDVLEDHQLLQSRQSKCCRLIAET